MRIEWRDHLPIGVGEIDHQHRQLFDKFNDFLAASAAERGADEISRLFWFLGAYVITHFADEERLQKRIGYPGYAEHRKLHQEFTRKFEGLKERLASEGPTRELISTVTLTVTGWLMEHISGKDRDIGRFIKEQERKGGRSG